MSDIDLKAVSDLSGMNFFIPSYQRGYRWTEQQVRDLLNDINEFKPKGDSYYCLQPVVVKERDKEYEVIDGQQRLTTIFLILKFLMKQGMELKVKDNHGEEKKWEEYELRYETRHRSEESDENGSWEFLSKIEKREAKEADNNIDSYHMWKAYETMGNWWSERGDDFDGTGYAKKLLCQTKFIWYKTDENDPVKVFTRLNIGKIPLTNAELIKALFLNRSNFGGGNDEYVRLRQLEIANEWDGIEYMLQNEEFWLFIHKEGYTNPTRIDFIFDLIFENDKLDAKERIIDNHGGSMKWNKIIGEDEYKTFRYFYEYFQLDDPNWLKRCWDLVKKYFQTFKEWYDDLEFYHYVGFLIDQGEEVVALLDEWEQSRTKKSEDERAFIGYLSGKIKEKISKVKNLEEQYGEERSGIDGLGRTSCRPLLLLHNIQTVINQGKNATGKYGLAVFYKFPFHIYKTEKWNVEHIDPNAPNPEDDRETQKAWLRNVKDLVDKELRNEIDNFTEDKIVGGYGEKYEELKQQILDKLEPDPANRLNDYEKNQIMNFTLLDESTNKGYGNSIFAVKRRIIIKKDKGENGTAFIPPCTKSVFLKYYSAASPSPNYWYKSDAEAYRDDIYNTLKCFDVKLSKGGTK